MRVHANANAPTRKHYVYDYLVGETKLTTMPNRRHCIRLIPFDNAYEGLVTIEARGGAC